MPHTASPIRPPPSLWEAVTPPGAALPPLAGDVRADVAVIGAGFTGLATALHLAEAGVDVVVLEAMAPGWGGSGRNNGQVIPALSRLDPDALVTRYGTPGERFVAMLGGSADLLFARVRKLGIAAEAEQTGWVQPAHSAGRLRVSEARVRQWARWGAAVEMIDRRQTRDMLGSDAWYGGLWNRSGGHVNPLALARGLGRALLACGGRIFAPAPVRSYARADGTWILGCDGGRVTARALVLATGAYTGEMAPDLAPPVAREVVPVRSWQMATHPVAAAIRGTVIPGRQAMSDTHGDLHFARWDARGRLVTGGTLVAPLAEEARLKARIGTRLRRIWPHLGEVTFDYVWNGTIAMTPDHAPRFHVLGPDAWGWTGCNGRGVALAFAVGQQFARLARGMAEQQAALPFGPPTPLPLHFLARRLAPLRVVAMRWHDSREITG